VFRAPRSLQPGADFPSEIIDNIHRCTVFLAVIGPGWLDRRLRRMRALATMDWVRREIVEAMGVQARIIPILVDNTPMPTTAELPADICVLANCHALRLRDSSAEQDMARIIMEITRILPNPRRRRIPARDPATHRIQLYQVADQPDAATRVGVIAGSIRQVDDVDIWVNSENTDMQMSRHCEFSLSGIIRYWGARKDAAGRVTEDVIADDIERKVGGCRPVSPGTVIVTTSGDLANSHHVRHVIHVAAVHGTPGMGFRQVANVEQCIINVLTTAERLAHADPEVRTIVVPLLGTGVAGAPVRPTINLILRACLDHVAKTTTPRLDAIYLLAYTAKECATLDDAIQKTPSLTLCQRADAPYRPPRARSIP
jgi:O-acetyl-ADP-ribose deacetylase (regulator of RNase III)